MCIFLYTESSLLAGWLQLMTCLCKFTKEIQQVGPQLTLTNSTINSIKGGRIKILLLFLWRL